MVFEFYQVMSVVANILACRISVFLGIVAATRRCGKNLFGNPVFS